MECFLHLEFSRYGSLAGKKATLQTLLIEHKKLKMKGELVQAAVDKFI